MSGADGRGQVDGLQQSVGRGTASRSRSGKTAKLWLTVATRGPCRRGAASARSSGPTSDVTNVTAPTPMVRQWSRNAAVVLRRTRPDAG